MKTNTKKITLIILAFFMAILCFVLTAFQSGIAKADENYAKIKGFDVEGLNYADDYNKATVAISNYGNMSLWVGKYNYWDESNQKLYHNFFIEARLCSNGLAGDYYNNQKMSISISHKNYMQTDVVTYSPEQTDRQYTVTESISVGTDTSGKTSFGYSYQISRTYSEISYTFSRNSRNDNDDIPILTTTFNFDFTNYDTDVSGRSPYAGEIVQRMAITYAVDYKTVPDGYDTDLETFTIDYTGIINRHPQVTWWFPSSEQNTISVRFRDGIAYEV